MSKRFTIAATAYITSLLLTAVVSLTGCNREEEPQPEAVVVETAPAPAPAAAESAAPQSAPAIPLEEALDTIAWQDVPAYLDREVLVVGRIVKTGRSKTGHVFLDFDKESDKAPTVFIDRANVDNFPTAPNVMYRGKTIRIHGFPYEYRGRPNISVKSPADITILPNDTPLPAPKTQPTTQAAGGSTGQWSMPADGTITLGTYNTLNLFDRFDDPYHSDYPDDEKPRVQVEALARSIRNLNADVLALEEVENRGVLERFVHAFLKDMGYEVVLFEGNDNRGIDVALLSRLPVGAVTSHRHMQFPDPAGKPMRFRRDLLQVRIEPPGGTAFDVFVVHLKSKAGEGEAGATSGTGDTRLGEAREVRQVFDDLLKQNAATPFVICGDFNDTFESEPIKTIVGSGPNALTMLFNDVPAESRISFNQPPHLSMIDYIFASPAMAARYVPASYRVVTGGSPETTGSDHNPVVAKFKVK